MNKPFDPDIAAMNLTEGEKAGLQVYRNYSSAFEDHRLKAFSRESPPHKDAISDLSDVLEVITTEEPRTVTVVSCAFADDQMKAMFKASIPEDVPGGRSAMLSGFGPLARFSQRIQMAHAFGWMSKDVLLELDHLRKVRNDVSHRWNLALLEERMAQLIESTQHPIEKYLGDGVRLPKELHLSLGQEQKFRIRLIWLLARVVYETRLWVPAMHASLAPRRALYGSHPPPMLRELSGLCIEMTRSRILQP